MFGLDPLKIGLGVLIAAILAGATLWVLQPVFNQKANEKAAAKVTAVVAAAKPIEAAAAAKVEGKSDAKVEGIGARSKARVAKIIASPDHDGEFYAGMCERELYKDDPECGGGGGKRGDR